MPDGAGSDEGQRFLLVRGLVRRARIQYDQQDLAILAEVRAAVRDLLYRAEALLAATEESLKQLLIPRDPNDDRNIVLELRAGAGGVEARGQEEGITRLCLHSRRAFALWRELL